METKVNKIYANKEKFLVIGLTGKTGSGCSTVTQILQNGYKEYIEFNDQDSLIQNKKNSIIKNFASKNFINLDKKFKLIKPSTLIMMLFVFEKQIIFGKTKVLKLLLDKKDEDIEKLGREEYENKLISELKEWKILNKVLQLSPELKVSKKIKSFIKTVCNENKKSILVTKTKIKLSEYIVKRKEKYQENVLKQNSEDLKKEISNLFKIDIDYKKSDFEEKLKQYTEVKLPTGLVNIRNAVKKKSLEKRIIIEGVLNYFSKKESLKFILLYEKYNNIIKQKRKDKILNTQQLQVIGDLVRAQIDIFQLPTYTNLLIKAYRKQSKNKSCYIVIDSLKNPFEILYFKERYSSYYTFSIHARDEVIYQRMKDEKFTLKNIKNIHIKELNLDKNDKQKSSLDSIKDFNSQNIIECTQRSDIYIDNNKDKKDTLYKQIFKYLSLIIHPGLITPTKDEMIMQLALNAKFNSGCISRQVGAVVLNKHDSVKSIGWNDVPEGQVPCLLRSHNELLHNSPLSVYSKYEKDQVRKKNEFKYLFTKENPNNQYSKSNEKGLNDSFCFKSIQNKIDNNKNQVYTRSLHAEENAFLQASKYGNSEIIGGQLFTTASPCFLCAKKAYQLGMKRIVYIEAYPDISEEQVFDIGTKEIEMVHFRGAIGVAYQKLYEPIFSYKDELKALNGVSND